MTSGEHPDKPDRDPADFLADMAGGKPKEIAPSEQTDEDQPDPLAALDLMATDDDDVPDASEAFQQSVSPGAAEDDALADFADGAGIGPTGMAARKARAARFEGHQRRHQAHLYKKTMAPLLLIVGILLVLVGILSVGMVIATGDSEKYTATYRYMIWVAVVSFPLSGVLFFGAWAFYRETTRR